MLKSGVINSKSIMFPSILKKERRKKSRKSPIIQNSQTRVDKDVY